jgi:Flp pilus assembly protein TadG
MKISRVFRLRSLVARDERGGALVEMAVAMPIMMIMLTGIFSFSMALYQKLQLSEAVSNGGRYLATSRGQVDPCSLTSAAVYSAAPGLSQANLKLTFTLNGVSYGSGVTTCPGASSTANSNMVAGSTAQIQASYPCTLSVYGLKFASCTLASQITENVQ